MYILMIIIMHTCKCFLDAKNIWKGSSPTPHFYVNCGQTEEIIPRVVIIIIKIDQN